MEEEQENVPKYRAFLSINNLPGGVGVYEFGDEIRATYLSRGLAKLLSYETWQYHTYTELNLLASVHESDRKRVGKLFSSLKRTHREFDVEFRIASKEMRWVRVLGKFARFHGQFPVYYLVVSDTTEAFLTRLKLEQQHARLDFAFSHSNLEIWEYELGTDQVTTLTRTILGGHPSLITKNPLGYLLEHDLIHPSFSETLRQDFSMLKEGLEPDSILLVRTGPASYRWLRSSYSFLRTSDGACTSAIGIFSDVHDEIETRLASLGEDYAFFAAFNLENGRPLLANTTVRKLLGGSVSLYDVYEQLLKRSIRADFLGLFAQISTEDALRTYISESNQDFTVEAKMQHPLFPAKGYPWVRFTLSISTTGGNTIGYIAIKDIDAEKKREAKLLERSQRDALTGLFNRFSLEEMIEAQLRQTDAGAYGFYLIDIDRFKGINDTFGHEMGDRVLRMVASCLYTFFPFESIVGRLGGDEFIAFVPKTDEFGQFGTLGTTFCKQIATDTSLGMEVHCSVGFCLVPEDGTAFDQLYHHADIALYRSKELGRNRCLHYEASMDMQKAMGWMNPEWVLDNLPDSIYVCDAETHALLFLNRAGRERFAVPPGIGLGRCHTRLFGRDSVCPFCSLGQLDYETYTHRVITTEDGQTLLFKEKLIHWNNRSAKMTVMVDQVKQAKNISANQQSKDLQQTTLPMGTYFQRLFLYAKSWDYDCEGDILTLTGFAMPLLFSNLHDDPKQLTWFQSEDAKSFLDALRSIRKTGKSETLFFRLRETEKMQTYVPYQGTCMLARNAQGAIQRIGGELVPFLDYRFTTAYSSLEHLINALCIPVLVLTRSSSPRFIFANAEFGKTIGSCEDGAEFDPLGWLAPASKSHLLEKLNEEVFESEVLLEDVNHRCYAAHVQAGPLFGTEQVVSISLQDISRERQLFELNTRMQNFVEQSLQGIVVLQMVNARLVLQYVNETLAGMLGYSRMDLSARLSANVLEIFHPEDRALLLREIELQSMCTLHVAFKLRLRRKDGTDIWCEITFRQTGVVGIGQPFSLLIADITKTMQTEQERELALMQLHVAQEHHALTLLYTRQRFYTKARMLLDAHEDERFVCIFWNVERFSVINELLGFETGNEVLLYLAERLRRFCQNRGVYAHLEGDHFAACIPFSRSDLVQVSTAMDCSEISDRIGFVVSLVYGIYEIEDLHMPINQILDRAMSAAKTIRFNLQTPYAFYTPSFRSDTLNEQEVLNDMSAALEQNQFTFYLQPIYHLSTMTMVSVEALARWDHPQRGMLPPQQFIPVFERFGFITTFDMYMLRMICSFLASVRDAGLPLVPIALNLSRLDLGNRQFVSTLIEIIDKYRLAHHLIQLEITETAYMENPRQVLQVIKHLQDLGFTILMDDFGTGYSSLNMLADLPLDIMKIDRSFIQDIFENSRSIPILSSLLQLGKNLGMPVVVEGVETKHQEEQLFSLGCEYVQGFLYNQPMDQSSFLKLISGG